VNSFVGAETDFNWIFRWKRRRNNPHHSAESSEIVVEEKGHKFPLSLIIANFHVYRLILPYFSIHES
jgi:hypothetical protein